ncbi:MAG: hypothetical protein ACLQFR_09435 [Streptosporangiaceae bacterium]
MSDRPNNPAHQPERDQRALAYAQHVSDAADRLDEQLASIRRDQDAGDITVREAADERVQVLGEHLDRLRLLRAEYLDDDIR